MNLFFNDDNSIALIDYEEVYIYIYMTIMVQIYIKVKIQNESFMKNLIITEA